MSLNPTIQNVELSQELYSVFQESILEFLGFEKEYNGADEEYIYDEDSVVKKITTQPSPRKECI